jgi:hypothetical protein
VLTRGGVLLINLFAFPLSPFSLFPFPLGSQLRS